MGCQVRQGCEGVGVGVGWCCCGREEGLLSGGWDVGLSSDTDGCLVSDADGWCLVSGLSSDVDDSRRLEPHDRAFLTNLPSCAYTGARFLTGPSRMEEASAGL